MQIKFHIPTEQYGFIEIDTTYESAQEAIYTYRVLSNYAKNSPQEDTGVPKNEFDTFLDTYLGEEGGEADVYARMNDEQKEMIQTIKRSIKRIKYKNAKP